MNTRRATHTLTALAAAALSATLTGCNASADTRPTETIGTCTECTAAPTPTATSTTADAAKEKADRAAAEAVWRKFVSLIGTVESLPTGEVDAAISSVAVDPTASRMRAENAQFRAQGRAGYGQAISFITWPQPIGGQDAAVLNDCQDESQAGYLDVKTGNKLTVGTINTPYRGTLQRTADGWRVAKEELVQGARCTPGK